MSRYINFAQAADLLVEEIQDVMRTSVPMGRTYGSHRASAPGQPPAIDTAKYIESWSVDRARLRRTQVSASVYSDYTVMGTQAWILALLLEHGTGPSDFGPGMAPRPHILVALNNVRAQIRELIRGG
jgi:hypothetical protein